MIEHPIPPLYSPESRVLILGSFPSVKSRETAFFYGHPQNRFWRVLAAMTNEEVPVTIEDKTMLASRHRIALWDVIHSCDITGSSDSSIRNVTPNDLFPVLQGSAIKHIYTNGTTSDRLYKKYLEQQTGIQAVCLPSTSPANARWSLELLIETWSRELKKYII